MTKPLAIVFYEKLLPGSQLVNRLADLGYRVTATQTAGDVLRLVREQKPLVLVADLVLRNGDFCGVIGELQRDPDTAHVPVLGIAGAKDQPVADAAIAAGAKLVAADSGILEQLPQLLDHVLAVE